MKIKTFEQYLGEGNEHFDYRVNYFIKEKKVVQITTNDVICADGSYVHTLTVVYKQLEE